MKHWMTLAHIEYEYQPNAHDRMFLNQHLVIGIYETNAIMKHVTMLKLFTI